MCGILFCVQRQEDITPEFELLWSQLKESNSARGPDAQDTYQTIIQSRNGAVLDVRLFASELRLRGDKPVVQPHKDENGVLCWNGEVFEGLEVGPNENDGEKLFGEIKTISDPETDLPKIFQRIEGPYAMAYLHNLTKRIYFGRDPLGRRSLLIHRPSVEKPYLLVASASAGSNLLYQLEEVDTSKFHYIDLNEWSDPENASGAEETMRTLERRVETISGQDFSTPAKVDMHVPDTPPLTTSLDSIPEALIAPVSDILYHLGRSTEFMVRDIPNTSREEGKARVALLFSGGIDSTMLAYFADKYLPIDEPIDLLNVAFENPRKIQVREEGNDNPKTKKIKAKMRNKGIATPEKGKFVSYLVPDRVTGLEELEELRRLSPKRKWNFVEVDITFEEMNRCKHIVENIMHPSRTVMDLSLALALYFASRGIGFVRDSPEGEKIPYTSIARVLLNGLGSDELLGGYGRHRTAYNTGGWQAVLDELQLEIDRIPTRNLGRDDRIISCHGKEARHPFLSLSVVEFIAKLPVHYKMDPRLPVGTGDKMLLRLAARKVGLELASARKKRAMQFGSHSARMEAGEGERRGDILLTN
ncbi:asparagine synthetase domain-containing 1 [Pyrrhoderma noxium]|uniref:Asparagine synthetase domain-containing 1 n=1 Tax=Pyrrhoderma noxium TaxID=2282107 RepID=A0A286URV3_9AGAM|nr:asparagine synthetase domain-containing 1 [Pyrrhoderma noxium]